MAGEIEMGLKLKYRTAKQPVKCGSYKTRTGNTHQARKKYRNDANVHRTKKASTRAVSGGAK